MVGNPVYSSQPCRFCCNADNENQYDGAMCVFQTLEENPKPVALVPLQDRPTPEDTTKEKQDRSPKMERALELLPQLFRDEGKHRLFAMPRTGQSLQNLLDRTRRCWWRAQGWNVW
jgi:hypothetical protein